LFFLILRSEFESKALYFWAGVLFGAGVLIHPFMAFRVGAILIFFFFFELIRRTALRDRLPPLFLCGGSFILGSALPLGIWLLPMVLRHGWEETYSYDYIVEHFKSVAPRGVGYIQKIRESSYGLADLYYWSKGNAGWFALIFSPVGVAVAFWKYRKTTSMFLLAWVSAMGSAAVLGYLLNPYRYFEYFFLGLMALAAYGLGGVYHGLGGRWRVFLLLGALAVAVAGIRIDFFPKYRQTLHYYGQTQWKEEFLQRSRNMAGLYINSKRQGRLDRELGGYTGYLWSRQKKVWEIYMSHPKGNK
jgi:hypothetical protein